MTRSHRIYVDVILWRMKQTSIFIRFAGARNPIARPVRASRKLTKVGVVIEDRQAFWPVTEAYYRGSGIVFGQAGQAVSGIL